MSNEKMRRRVAWEAARLMYTREESEYYRAKMKAARRIYSYEPKPSDLPSNREIRDQIQAIARVFEGHRRAENLRQMRIEALRLMRILKSTRPRLVGSVLTGHIRRGSDIDIHVFSDSVEAVCAALETEGLTHDVESKKVRKHGEEKYYTHVRVQDRFQFELTVYPANMAHYVFKSSITGRAMERVSIAELEILIAEEHPEVSVDEAVVEAEAKLDRFQVYEALLLPLERVKERPKDHPECDVLYHSLQVFDLARQELPYDEEFLLAALLHDVGKAIDRKNHVTAGLEALDDCITPRTAWLIEHHMEGHLLANGTIGVRSRRRLEVSEDFEELKLLAKCDRDGRRIGVPAPDVQDAIDYLRDLARLCEG
jgi:hypothetical protein